MSAVHPMVLKAARAWCKRHAEACGLDEATLWAEREAGFVTEAQAAIEACGAIELLAALVFYAERQHLQFTDDNEQWFWVSGSDPEAPNWMDREGVNIMIEDGGVARAAIDKAVGRS